MRRIEILALAAVWCVATVVAFRHLGTASWNDDELLYGRVGRSLLEGNTDLVPGIHPFLGAHVLGFLPWLTGSVSPLAVRAPAALASLCTAGLLFLLGARIAGRGAGVAALAMWALLPHAAELGGVPLAEVRIDRYGLLDVLLVAFMTGSLYTGWRWAESDAWRWAAATGLLAGCATATKLIGVLVLVPVALLVAMSPGQRGRQLGQLVSVVLACPFVLAVSILPVDGDPIQRVGALVDEARAWEAIGHATIVAGEVYQFPPWWSNAFFLWEGVGPVATVALVLLAVVGCVKAERRAGVYLATALVVPAAFLALAYDKALPHYYLIWMPPLTLLAALGLVALACGAAVARVAAAVAAVALTGVAVDTALDVERLRPRDYQAVAALLRDDGFAGRPVAVYGHFNVLGAYIGVETQTAVDGRTEAIVIDPLYVRRWGYPRAVRRLAHGRPGEWARLDVDRFDVLERRAAGGRSELNDGRRSRVPRLTGRPLGGGPGARPAARRSRPAPGAGGAPRPRG